MGWKGTDPVASPSAGQTLDSFGPAEGGHFTVTVALTSPGPWTVILRRRSAQNRITNSLLLASDGGSVVLGPFVDIQLAAGDLIEVVNRDAVAGEYQATIFTRRGR